MLSIVIPTLDAARTLGDTLASVSGGRDRMSCEIIVADGGSTDHTRTIATNGGAVFLAASTGRGPQLREGAAVASGDWLLFLHADTRLGADWDEAARAFIDCPENARCAGFFRFALDDAAIAARWLERLVDVRSRILGFPYGDQALLISRPFYDDLGGYKGIPLMEDVDLVRRIGRRWLRPLAAVALTSADRYRRDGYAMRPLRNLFCLGLYSAGVPPKYISGLYR